jgi:hypothetical protein
VSYWDIDPQDIDPDTGMPYANYSSPSLDTSFHDHEMDVDEPEAWIVHYREGTSAAVSARGFIGPYDTKEEAERKTQQMVDRFPYWVPLGAPVPLGTDRHCEHCDDEGIEPCGMSSDAGDGEGEDRPCSVCCG